jgi:anthranilate phosphoribosyltransferase
MKTLVDKLRNGVDLTASEISLAVGLLLSDETSDALKSDFLAALHHKGESADEIAGFAEQLIARAVDPQIEEKTVRGPIVDISGTGGAGLELFNVSTTVMFVLAAAGVAVVKHGERSVTSRCGSADVLEKLGVKIDLTPAQLRECVQQIGFGFAFARQFHPAFRSIAAMRERLAQQKQRTIFNLLGPLLNPVRPQRQLIGVFAPRLTTVVADVLRRLGRERAWIVHGLAENGEGMDNISTSGVTTLAELAGGKITTGVIDPRWLDIPHTPLADVKGADVPRNAEILERILSGEIHGGMRDLALVNAGGGFVVAGVVEDIREGITLAREQIDSGKAVAKLRALQRFQPNSAG